MNVYDWANVANMNLIPMWKLTLLFYTLGFKSNFGQLSRLQGGIGWEKRHVACSL